ncbi:hypothetical protein ACOMHN_066184 [Nucella lapillus]
MMDDDESASATAQRNLAGSRDQPTPSHVTPFCPIVIRIDECSSSSSSNNNSDSENDNDNDRSREEDYGICNGGSAGKLNSQILAQPQHRTVQTLHNKQQQQPRDLLTLPNNNNALGCKSSPILSQRCSPSLLDVPENSELSTVKATAVRLNLRTRTSSFMEWQAKWLDNSRAPPQFPLPVEEGSASGEEGVVDRLTKERMERICEALDWLKTELKEMRSLDQHLARQLLSLRHDIHQLRLRRSCQEHRDLLDDVQSELEEQVEMSDVLDLPNDLTLNDTPLKQIGVTRMNISRRRFSMC